MTYISIDTNKKKALQFLEYVKTLPFAKINEEPSSFLKTKTEDKKGKIKKDKNNKSHFVFAPEVITAGKKTYQLKFPLLSTMKPNKGRIEIENKMLGIYVYGATTEAAEQMFSEEFDYIVERYNGLPDSKLTTDVKAIKTFLNHIIKK